MHQIALTVFQLDNVSNASTGLRLWQAETKDFGASWTAPHPFVIPQLHADNVTAGTHIAPGNGIELQNGPYAGRLLAVLIHATQDVVVYSDNGGRSWQMSETPLPQNGEAQLAEVHTSHHAARKQTAIVFNGRTGSTKRGIAWSYDNGVTFTDTRFAQDLTGGTDCMASILSLLADPRPAAAMTRYSGGAARHNNASSLLFSHPSGANRTHKSGRNAGVLLRSDDDAETWYEVTAATPEDAGAAFGYSNLNLLPIVVGGGSRQRVGLTFETNDVAGCDEKADACKIVYRTLELKILENGVAVS